MVLTRVKLMRSTVAAFALSLPLILSACQEGIDNLYPKAERPIPDKLIKKMKAKGMTSYSPILVRIFKQESTLEVWKKKNTGRYDLLETYEICKWSGKLGPKFKEGDRQAPEGFYTVAQVQMNPLSSYHLSFNMGYPNTYDRANNRTGTHLMVHGACSSAGCYSMTDELVEEIYALARESFKGGQRKFQIQAFPFRMTPDNMVRNEDNEHFPFWQMLKIGNDHFELTNFPPKIDICDKKYVFNRQVEEGVRFRSTAACPQSNLPERLEKAYLQKAQADNLAMNEIRAKIVKKKQFELQRAEIKKRRELLRAKMQPSVTDPVDKVPQDTTAEVAAQKTMPSNSQLVSAEILDIAPPSPIISPQQPLETTRSQIIPQPRPLLEGEEVPVTQKKRTGFFSWLKSN